MTISLNFFDAAAMMPPDANGPAGFTTNWHGHGANHQANNNPGDTAADRHGFGNDTAGKSGHNPTAGSAQDDFSAATGLPAVSMDHAAMPHDEDETADDLLDVLI